MRVKLNIKIIFILFILYKISKRNLLNLEHAKIYLD